MHERQGYSLLPATTWHWNIFYQNIREFRNKGDELMNSFVADPVNPHILCLSKHRMKKTVKSANIINTTWNIIK
jgi:hypothetical protein